LGVAEQVGVRVYAQPHQLARCHGTKVDETPTAWQRAEPMVSLRSIAACIGVAGNFSVVRDFFGYATGVYGHIPLSTDLSTITEEEAKIDPSAPGELSLLTQVKLLEGPHIHLDIIRVGIEDFATIDEQEIDVAVQMTRELYARVGLGIGRVLRWFLTTEQAGGLTVIDTECEAFDLIDDWSAHGGGMDVFFVRDIDFGKGGGTPEKDPEGTVIGLSGNVSTGITLAHELGHYLGLDHVSTKTNLMLGSGFPKPNYDLTPTQAATMKSSGHVKSGCA